MRLAAAPISSAIKMKSLLFSVCGICMLAPGLPVLAQSVPETLRINVEPAEPGIRSVIVNKKYRPVISRDGSGVVIDTADSSGKLPDCDVKLEVTLENSRILHRDADICGGGVIVVDVSSDGKPGASARVVGEGAGVVAGPTGKGAQTTASTSTQRFETTESESGSPSITTVSPPEGSGGLKPLERVETPVSTPGADTSQTASVPQDFETLVQDSLSDRSANSASVLVQPNETRQWTADPGSQQGAVSYLQHGVPQTNDRDFRAECSAQTGFAKITFQQAPQGLKEGAPQTVRVNAGEYSATYTAFGSSNSNEAGVSLPEVNVEMTDPLWEAMIRQAELSISMDGLPALPVSLKGSANPVRLFVATCSLPQQIVSDEAFGVSGQDPSSDLSCSEIGRVRSVEAVRPGQIVFRNASRQAIEIHWVDYRGGERPYARLEPGQILEQQTYVSHAWTVRGAGGDCRGIYLSRTPYREVTINGAANIGTAAPGPFPGAGPGTLNAPLGGQGGFGAGQQNNNFPAGPVPPADIGGSNQLNLQQAASTNVADYLCTAGIDLNVVFSPDGLTATVAEMGYGSVTLQRGGGPNTFYFESQGHVLKGQLQNASWSRPGLRDVFCAVR